MGFLDLKRGIYRGEALGRELNVSPHFFVLGVGKISLKTAKTVAELAAYRCELFVPYGASGGRNGIRIGANVNISTGASIWTMQHEVDDPYFGTGGGTVSVEDRVWVSCNTIILPGVTVREGSVIAAGAVVTKDTEAYSINGGLPSRKIGERSQDLRYNFDGSYMHFL